MLGSLDFCQGARPDKVKAVTTFITLNSNSPPQAQWRREGMVMARDECSPCMQADWGKVGHVVFFEQWDSAQASVMTCTNLKICSFLLRPTRTCKFKVLEELLLVAPCNW